MRWAACPEFSNYEVSEYGHLRRPTDAGRYPAGYMKTPRPHQRGYIDYQVVRDDGREMGMLAHRLVALAFIGPPPTPEHEVAHNDGSRTNNHYKNLRWATPAENTEDRKLHGTFYVNEDVAHTKVSNAVVADIRARYAEGGQRYRRGGAVTMQQLADENGLSIAQISRIVNGRRRPIHP